MQYYFIKTEDTTLNEDETSYDLKVLLQNSKLNFKSWKLYKTRYT